MKRTGAKIPRKVADALLKVLDPPTGLSWRKVKIKPEDRAVVAAAVNAAEPKEKQKADFKADVASAIHAIAEAGVGRTKAQDVKDAAEVYAAALIRVERASKLDLLPSDLMINPIELGRLIASAKDFAELARKESAKNSMEQEREPVTLGHNAAMHAHALLEKYGLKISGSANGRYSKLAAVLAGKSASTMARYCRAHIKYKKSLQKR